MSNALEVTNLKASIGDLEILRGVDLTVPFGEVHAVMGPNGSGKSTLCHALMGKSDYETSGDALVDGVDIMGMTVDERARAGLFEAFQYPTEIPGVTLNDLTEAMAASNPDDDGYAARESATTKTLSMNPFRERFVNVGLSGGEKKRSEMYLLGVAKPKMAILDEIDSGLDIDAVREVAAMVEAMRSDDMGILIITHYSRILRYMDVDKVHVMVNGRIVQSGGPEVAEELESGGYTELQAANAR
ncbi:MAG: Fe-S cluster assembly ATPase SufC [Armatimonadetes bacterium]|nr:MAG: Fe-S cluster assembly ATPase SufC [Armatimonadota bacterium]